MTVHDISWQVMAYQDMYFIYWQFKIYIRRACHIMVGREISNKFKTYHGRLRNISITSHGMEDDIPYDRIRFRNPCQTLHVDHNFNRYLTHQYAAFTYSCTVYIMYKYDLGFLLLRESVNIADLRLCAEARVHKMCFGYLDRQGAQSTEFNSYVIISFLKRQLHTS